MAVDVIKRIIRRAIARLAPGTSSRGIRVLLYHDIDEPDPADRMGLRVSRARFVEQMTALRADGCEVVPLDAVSGVREPDGRVRVAITFDDGYRSQAWAAGVLREFGFPATFFVVPRFLDGIRTPAAYWESWGHLDWDDAGVLLAEGFDIGAHSATHPDLRTCDSSQLDAETQGSRTLLERRLGGEVPTFSYPYGRHDDRVRDAVKRAGYRLACSSRYGVNRAVGRHPFAVQRTEIHGQDQLSDFRAKLRGKYDWLGYWQDLTASRQRGEPN